MRPNQLLVLAAAACIIVLTSCSGGSSDVAGPSAQPAESSTLNESTPATGSEQVATEFDPHCWDLDGPAPKCPRQTTPTQWKDLHEFTRSIDMYPIRGTQVVTVARSGLGIDELQVWDVTDPDWGRAVAIEPPGGHSLQGRRWHLGDGVFAYRYGTNEGSDNGVAVYDLLADTPDTPIFTQALSGTGRLAAPLDNQRIGLNLRVDNTTELQVWTVGSNEPTNVVTVNQVLNLAGDRENTLYFVTSRPREMWKWEPPAAPELVGPLPTPNENIGNLEIAPSGRLLLVRDAYIDVFDPATGQITTLTGVDPGLADRFRAIAASELPDGRIVAHYPEGQTAYWDVAQPDNPTITLAEFPREWTGASTLDTGQILQGWGIFAGGDHDFEQDDAVELITPPAP